MNITTQQVRTLLKDWRVLSGVGGVLFFIFLFVFSSKESPERKEMINESSNIPVTVKSSGEDNDGLFLSEEVDRKAFVGRLEDQYHSTQEKSRKIETRIEGMEKKLLEITRAQMLMNESLLSFSERLVGAEIKQSMSLSDSYTVSEAGLSDYRVEVVNVGPISEAEPEGIFLPVGSFVKGTLLTGVYAPSDQNNPLPVLIRLNEAFYGPNESRIQLEGAFVIGKASAELNSERALIQAVNLSVVLPNGKEFQHQGNIGYVTDIKGDLGLKGIVVRNTGAQMAASFMSGFLGGASQAVADGETTVTTSSSGRVARNVTGNISRHAAFQGLSQSASQLSKYYSDQLSSIVPAVRVEAGMDVYLIILEGVRINGLQINQSLDVRYFD